MWRLRVILCLAMAGAESFAIAQHIRVSGYVTDAQTGEVLIGAGVLSGTDGTVTNEYGFYSLAAAPGDVRFSYIGYQSVTIPVQRDSSLSVALVPGASLSGATVFANKEDGIHSSLMGVMEVPAAFLRNTPVPFGEPDLLKTIQLLPGVQGGAEGTTGLYIRGGNVDETLYLLDGVPMYNVSHLLGMFSAYSPGAVKKATVYKGSFPARFGGRASGIVDTRTSDGDLYRTRGAVSVGMLTSRAQVEGPIVREKLSYNLSARGMHTLLFAPVIRWSGVDFNYWFYDLNGKLTWRAGDRDRLFLSAYLGDDQFHNEPRIVPGVARQKTRMNWGNALAAFRWSHVFGPSLFSDMQLSYSRFRSDSQSEILYGEEENGSSYANALNSGIRDILLNYNLDWTPSRVHRIRAGIHNAWHIYTPGTHFSGTDFFMGEKTVLDEQHRGLYQGLEAAVYGEDNLSIGSWFQVNVGLRAVLMVTGGKNYGSIEPRISSQFLLGHGGSIKISGGRTSQHVHLLTSSYLAMPSDIWVPVTDRVAPVVTDHVALGAYYSGLSGWEFVVEGYYKHAEGVVEYKDGASYFTAQASWETIIASGEGRAYGVEFLARKTAGALTGWIAYTLSKSERRFPDGSVSGGDWFPHKYDRRHVASVCANYRFNEKWDISASWSFESGYMTTLSEGATLLPSTVFPGSVASYQMSSHITQRNNYRLPPSHRLSVSANWRRKYRRTEGLWQFGIYNVYNAMNPNLVHLRDVYPKDETAPVKRSTLVKITWLPILPSVSYTLYFGKR